jgi:hypothetical protein
VPDSPRKACRLIHLCLIASLAILGFAGCGAGVPTPSIPDFGAAFAGGSATFDIDGTSVRVSQSGSIQASFPDAPELSYSGPNGCKGRYFNGDYTENIEVFFRYTRRRAYLLIDNGAAPVYRFGPPQRQGSKLVFSNPTPNDRQITVTIDCPTGS